MVISVPITSSSILSLLSPAQLQQIADLDNPSTIQLEIQNLGANDLFYERNAAAAAASGRKILATTGTLAINTSRLDRCFLISSGGVNANVRLTINS
jgi:hypothetical protein